VAAQHKTPEQLAEIAEGVVKLVVAQCGPADAIMASVLAVKIIGEMARMECGEEAAQQMLIAATEKARTVHVRLQTEQPEDPFVIEPKDPFSIPE